MSDIYISRKSLVGQKFGRLTVLDHTKGNGNPYLICLCDCSVFHIAHRDSVLSGTCSSCGCYRREYFTKHGATANGGTATYHAWGNMKSRCYNKNLPQFKDYGGRGITVCDRWRDSFSNFLEDMGECPPGLTIDRIDNDRGYEPNNCRWSDRDTQARNRRIPWRKLTWSDVDEIRSLPLPVSYTALGRKYGVAKATIRDVVIGRSWKVKPEELL